MVSACERSRCTILNSSSLRDITEPRHAPRAPRVSSNALPRALFLPQKQASKIRGRAGPCDATPFWTLAGSLLDLRSFQGAKANAVKCPRFPEFQFQFQQAHTARYSICRAYGGRRQTNVQSRLQAWPGGNGV